MVCPPGCPVYVDSCTAARASGPGGPQGMEALSAPWGPSNRPPRRRGRQVQPGAAPPVPAQSESADRPQSCEELGHLLPLAVVGDQGHVSRPGGGVSRPATPPVGSALGSPSLPAGAWSTRQHTTPRARTAPHARHHTRSDRGTLVSCPGWSPTTRGTHPALADPGTVSRASVDQTILLLAPHTTWETWSRVTRTCGRKPPAPQRQGRLRTTVASPQRTPGASIPATFHMPPPPCPPPAPALAHAPTPRPLCPSAVAPPCDLAPAGPLRPPARPRSPIVHLTTARECPV